MNWFRNLNIQNKLFIAFGMLVIMVIILSVFSVTTADKVDKSYINFLEGPQKRVSYASDSVSELMAMRRYMMCMTFLTDNVHEVEQYYTKYTASAEMFLHYIDNYYENLHTDAFLSEYEKAWRIERISQIRDTFTGDYTTYSNSMHNAILARDLDAVNDMMPYGILLGDDMTEKLRELSLAVQESMGNINNETQELSRNYKLSIVIMSVFITFISFIAAFFMSRLIKSPIVSIKTAVAEVSKGNLLYPIRSDYKDEIGMLSNHIGDMIDKISMLNKSVSILDNLDTLIFVSDFDYNLIYYNRKIATTYSLPKEPSPNLKCYKILCDFDEPCSDCELQKLEPDKENYPFVEWERKLTIGGQNIVLAGRSSVIRWIDGSLVMVCASNDNTARKEHEEQQLRYEKERAEAVERENKQILVSRQSLQTVLDALPIPVRIVDLERNDIVYANDSLVELLGYNSSDELCGLKLADILPKATNTGIQSAKLIDMTVNSGELISFEVDYQTRSGDIIEALLSTRHIEYNGRLSSIGIIKDLTAEKERERILENAAQKEKEANQSKSLFLANMSHEIRTPMNGIIGFSELALDDNISQQTKDYLNKIKSSSESLLEIINNILDISKIEAGKIEIEKIPFEINDVFKLCRTITTPKVLEKGITLFCYAEPSVSRALLGDPTRLRQALLNLLSNAVKFTNTGMVKLLAAILKTTEDSVTMHFEVKDNGIGMTAAQIENIFKPFVQADNSIARKYGGTGLGLTITKNIVELMGGNLKVESTPGLGSKFSFDITFKTLESASGEYIKKKSDNSKLGKPNFSGEVLVCEDNELNQEVIRNNLLKVGLTPVIAANGKIGVDYVRRRMESNAKPFDLIFMDIHMPIMDGLDAAKKLLDMGSKTPVVALTANIMANDKETYEAVGMCDCVPKPFSAHELWECLLKYLNPITILAVNETEQNKEDEKQREMMISGFVRSNITTFEDINNAVRSGDIKLAHRIAHTLKGTAGAIGMTMLQKTAQIIENSLTGNEARFTDEQMAALEFELNTALNELAPFACKRKHKETPSQIIDTEKVFASLAKLDSLLEADSFDCLMMTDELEEIPGTELLIEQIEAFNFKKARDILANIRHKLEEQQ